MNTSIPITSTILPRRATSAPPPVPIEGEPSAREAALARELAGAVKTIHEMRLTFAAKESELRYSLAVEKKANEFLTAQWTAMLEHLAELEAGKIGEPS